MCRKPTNPRVLNRHTDNIIDAVYVGRPSKWGNPYSHLAHSSASFRTETRSEAVNNYRTWLRHARPDLIQDAQRELKGKDLYCGCTGTPCHAYVLLEVANEESLW